MVSGRIKYMKKRLPLYFGAIRVRKEMLLAWRGIFFGNRGKTLQNKIIIKDLYDNSTTLRQRSSRADEKAGIEI